VHCTKISPEFEWQGKGQGHLGQKKRQSVAFCLGVILWGAVLVQHFFRERSSGAAMPMEKSAHAV